MVLLANHGKSTTIYWNPLNPANRAQWTPAKGLEHMAEELPLSTDPETGEYTRLTRFHAGADTTALGGKSHRYPEEVFIVSGRLYDHAFGKWLETGALLGKQVGDTVNFVTPATTDEVEILEIDYR